MTSSISSSFNHHNDDNISTNTVERTKVLHGPEKVIDVALQFTSNAEDKIDACVDHTRPSLIVEIREINEAFHDAKKRGVKLRCITEITAENVSFCKLLATMVDELRHLDGVKGNFYVSERQYIAPAASHEKGKPPSQIICSNMKETVEEQQYIFDTLWYKSISSEDKIKEIEQGIEPEYFRVINDNQEATTIIKHSQFQAITIRRLYF